MLVGQKGVVLWRVGRGIAMHRAAKSRAPRGSAQVAEPGGRAKLGESCSSQSSISVAWYAYFRISLRQMAVTSTLQNLALIGSNTAFDMTGAKIAASSTNVTANVSNVFDGMKLTLEAGGEQFEAYIKDVAAKTSMSV